MEERRKYVNIEGAGDDGEKRGPESTPTTTSNLLSYHV